MAGRNGDDMSDPISVIAFPDDLRLGFKIEFHLDDTWYGNRPTVATSPLEHAIPIGY